MIAVVRDPAADPVAVPEAAREAEEVAAAAALVAREALPPELDEPPAAREVLVGPALVVVW